ncbi:MAG TPA: hypothetical protein VD993_10125 [Chitinophagaceae bacterium]|nr:hypothetical protein [Chitinophagaceae bacterium]
MNPFTESGPEPFPVKSGKVDEASGMADSYSNPGYLWVHEDSGRPTDLHLLSHDGTVANKISIQGVTNRDWEEMAISNGPEAGKKYVYIGETGDNSQAYPQYFIYRFAEPAPGTDTVHQVDKLQFRYPDGPHDSEAFFVDPTSKDIYLITKRDAYSKVYRLAYPQSTTAINTAVFVTDLPYSGVVAAAYFEDRQELLIKTYHDIYYYKRGASQSVADLLKMSYLPVPHTVEPQGEALCFANDGSGFFTLSEKAFAAAVNLNFYRRK